MNNILFPTDFSEASAKAFQFAVAFTDAVNAKLTLFHAYQSTYSPRRPLIGERSAKERTMKRLREFAKLHTEGDTWKNISLRTRKGYSIRSLIKLSKNPAFDMIIMGKGKGYDWLTKIIGSKTSYVSKMAHCPVLVVPPHQTFEDTAKIMITGIIPQNREKKLMNFLDAINLNNTGAEYSMIRLDKDNFRNKGLRFRAWPQLILSLEIPALVINDRFWKSKKVAQKTREIGMDHLMASAKFGTNLN